MDKSGAHSWDLTACPRVNKSPRLPGEEKNTHTQGGGDYPELRRNRRGHTLRLHRTLLSLCGGLAVSIVKAAGGKLTPLDLSEWMNSKRLGSKVVSRMYRRRMLMWSSRDNAVDVMNLIFVRFLLEGHGTGLINKLATSYQDTFVWKMLGRWSERNTIHRRWVALT